MMVLDSGVTDRLIKERQERGIDQYDEVWEGVYMMSPLVNDEHQEIVGGFVTIFGISLGLPGLAKVRPGVNVSDREEDWKHNYRIPDIAVYLQDTIAQCFDAFWRGGPDFGVEVVSKNDKTRDKLDFYEKVGTQELLIVDRDPWQLELLRLTDGKFATVGAATTKNGQTLASRVIPFTFRLETGEARPVIVVEQTSGETWRV